MTNEEKAREIAECNDGHINIISFKSAKIMAEWKDQQFKEYIETHKQPVLASETDDTIVGYSIDADEIINELFGEE